MSVIELQAGSQSHEIIAPVPEPVANLDAQALEWQPLLALLAGYAASAVGRTAIEALTPSTVREWIERQHQLVSELRTLLESAVSVALGGLFDPTTVLAKAQIPDAALKPSELQAIARLANDIAAWQTLIHGPEGRGEDRTFSTAIPGLIQLSAALATVAARSAGPAAAGGAIRAS